MFIMKSAKSKGRSKYSQGNRKDLNWKVFSISKTIKSQGKICQLSEKEIKFASNWIVGMKDFLNANTLLKSNQLLRNKFWFELVLAKIKISVLPKQIR